MTVPMVIAIVMLTTTASAQPLPQPKVGQCPAGYRKSGGYCAPTSDRAPVTIPKSGQCPSGFVQTRGILPRHEAALKKKQGKALAIRTESDNISLPQV